MTPAQERRLLHAALGYAHADHELQVVRRGIRTGETDDPKGVVRKAAAKALRAWKLRLLRAAGAHRKQPLLPLHKGIE